MSLELFDDIDIIKKHYNLKNPEGATKLDENEEDRVINLPIVCKNKIAIEKEGSENHLNNYIKALKIIIRYIPFNDSIKKKITEKKLYQNLFLGRQNYNSNSNIMKEEIANNNNTDNNYDTSRENINSYPDNIKLHEDLLELYSEVDKYELILLINLITHNGNSEDIFEFLYPYYFYYIILNKFKKDNVFMLLNNFIINKKTYDKLIRTKDFSFVLFLSVLDSLKKIKNDVTTCNYFYVFIENSLKYENHLFIHIIRGMRSLYTDFYGYIQKMKENIFLFFKKNIVFSNRKILNITDNKNYILKYISLMFRLIFETLYNILDEKNFKVEQVLEYKNLYKTIIEQIKENLIYINEINYFDNFVDVHIDLYSNYVLFMDMFVYYKKKFNLEIFKLILFISNIFSDHYEALDDLTCSEKKVFIDIIFTYLKTIHKMRNDHLLKNDEILYHKFVLNRYIISIVANFSVNNIISNYIKKLNGLDTLRKFMYIDDKDPCLPEYITLAIKHIKENENFNEL
ncbi:conserved Plasmodium protein, unknown function [Plasmodium malariae]|uniref:Uncharacterized protein n=1 Tax=Plasmodium malariae TaxID=5858 RepID=A0A1C3L1R4_PLAMA|nr:conserved Plasmodium protein, unknown function [Plasmodium malariae]